MDPFSRLLKKQRERSLVQEMQEARKAKAGLTRQLTALDRQDDQLARAFRRTKTSLLEELQAFRDIDHEVRTPDLQLPRTPKTPPKTPRALPPMETRPAPPPQAPPSALAPPPAGPTRQPSVLSLNLQGGVVPHTGRSLSLGRSTTSLWLDGGGAGGGAETRRSHSRAGSGVSRAGGRGHGCRYRALSPLAPCAHFPCSPLRSYHRMRVSKVGLVLDPAVLAMAGGWGRERSELGGLGLGREATLLGQGGEGGGGTTNGSLSPRRASQVSTLLTERTNLTYASLASSQTLASVFSSATGATGATASTGITGITGLTGITRLTGQTGLTSVAEQVGRGDDADNSVGVQDRASPRASIRDRVRGLKKVTRKMRDRNDRTHRPRPWAVNYGQPVSKKVVRKAALEAN